ncbi:hypothetical protein ACFQ8W_00315 [Streptomyces sp. NPDC056508]|uniref:hypothetical protein n=1 Tax=Streptomyces sp. NPDC056508 TaxID=3345845 RepID=UPI003687AB2F
MTADDESRLARIHELRKYDKDPTALLCIGLCRRRRPREEFRETPWHGRAAECIRCETFPGPAGRSLWQIKQDERTHWEYAQTREKLRMYQRYARTLRAIERGHAWRTTRFEGK